MPDAMIDELKAGWEQIREKVAALQKSVDFYRERNEQLVKENLELRTKLSDVEKNLEKK